MSDNKILDFNINGLRCDAPDCDFIDMDITLDQYPNYLNAPCPKCGANLLTQEDFDIVQAAVELSNLCAEIPYEPKPGELMFEASFELNGTGTVQVKKLEFYKRK